MRRMNGLKQSLAAMILVIALMMTVFTAAADTIISPSFTLPDIAEEGTPEEEASIEETPEEEAPAPQPVLELRTNLDPGDLKVGDMFIMSAVISGLDDISYTIEWQCNNGSGWTAIPGANSRECGVLISEDKLGCKWRYVINTSEE